MTIQLPNMEGKIYKLTCEDLTYYGSTTKKYISERFAAHKYNWKHQKNLYTSSLLFDRGEVKCELVEILTIQNKKQLHQRERYYIENFDCVNKHIPNQTQLEYQKKYSKTEKRKNAVNERNRKRVICEICNKELSRGNIHRHKRTFHNS